MDTAVFSVVYTGVELFLPELLRSLSDQTDNDFTLFLINDGMADLEKHLEKVDLDVEVLEKSVPAAELRKIGIEWIISKGAKKIIFVDADDHVANNRVEVTKEMLDEYDIIVNELMLIGESYSKPVTMFGKFFEERKEISTDDMMTGNCMGLTNTAIRAESISRDIESVPNNIIAFDWALFAMCIHAGARAVFTKETQTYYRQHNNNTAFIQCFSEQQIMRGVKVKRDHYKLMTKFYKEYDSYAEEFENLLSQLQGNNGLKQEYCEAVRHQGQSISLWWEPIKSLEELGI
ncbi:MAG: glycosyltransferase family 2 protein [Candidatus Scalindua sediminis]|nr:glycosyltransferase family 2 protein [Candidatus Scalindua sediminis]